MPYDPSVLHPVAEHCYRLALVHGSQMHPLACAFWAEAPSQEGNGPAVLADAYSAVNLRRAERGLEPVNCTFPGPPEGYSDD